MRHLCIDDIHVNQQDLTERSWASKVCEWATYIGLQIELWFGWELKTKPAVLQLTLSRPLVPGSESTGKCSKWSLALRKMSTWQMLCRRYVTTTKPSTRVWSAKSPTVWKALDTARSPSFESIYSGNVWLRHHILAAIQRCYPVYAGKPKLKPYPTLVQLLELAYVLKEAKSVSNRTTRKKLVRSTKALFYDL